MGLDNGFTCKNLKKEEIPSFIIMPWYCKEDEVEIAYWRKAWGLRNEILSALHMHNDEYEIKVDREDIPAILRIIKKYFHEDYFIDNANTIWEYDEILDNYIQNYINLFWLYEYMENHPEIELIFYDSY